MPEAFALINTSSKMVVFLFNFYEHLLIFFTKRVFDVFFNFS